LRRTLTRPQQPLKLKRKKNVVKHQPSSDDDERNTDHEKQKPQKQHNASFLLQSFTNSIPHPAAPVRRS
jgi:hypothetical protein